MNNVIASEHDDFICQQDGAPPHWKLTVRAYLNDSLPGRRIGRTDGEGNMISKWHSPDLETLQFFSFGICDKLSLCSQSSCQCKRAQTKNHYCTGDCYARYAAACLGGARLPIGRVPCNRR